MIRRLIGKTSVLCAVVAITVVLVAVAWIATSRFSADDSGKVPAVAEETSPAQPVEDPIKTKVKELASDIRNSKVVKAAEELVDPQDDEDEAKADVEVVERPLPQENVSEPDQIYGSGPRGESIEELRQASGRIAGRSGLFSDNDSPNDDSKASASDRQYPVYVSTPQPEINKNTANKQSVVLEREAYDDAKVKVDEMLRDLGYTE